MIPGIPSSFEIMGQEITVEYVEDLATDHGAYGRSVFNKNLIQIQTPGPEYNERLLQQTFFHEFTHFVCFHTGFHDACTNEQFVDLFGHCIFQMLISSEYPEPKTKKKRKTRSRAKK